MSPLAYVLLAVIVVLAAGNSRGWFGAKSSGPSEYSLLNKAKTAAAVFVDGDSGAFGGSFAAPDAGDKFTLQLATHEEVEKIINNDMRPSSDHLYKLVKGEQALGWLGNSYKFGWYTIADDLNLILLEKISDDSYALWMQNDSWYILSGGANAADAKTPLFIYRAIVKDGQLSPEQRAFQLVSA